MKVGFGIGKALPLGQVGCSDLDGVCSPIQILGAVDSAIKDVSGQEAN